MNDKQKILSKSESMTLTSTPCGQAFKDYDEPIQ